jgi:hypothetical protein
MKVYLVFTDAGLYGVYRTRKLAKFYSNKLGNRFSVKTWLETWPLVAPWDNLQSINFGEDEDNDIQ